MREAIGGTWIFQIVIFFMSINHSKAFNVKDAIINTIEREEGVDLNNPEDPAIKKIVEYLKNTSYRTTGTCPKVGNGDNYQGFDREGKINNRNPAFCLKAVEVGGNSELPSMMYYQVVVFYQLDLPIFNNVFNFRVSGDTKIISHSNEVGI